MSGVSWGDIFRGIQDFNKLQKANKDFIDDMFNPTNKNGKANWQFRNIGEKKVVYNKNEGKKYELSLDPFGLKPLPKIELVDPNKIISVNKQPVPFVQDNKPVQNEKTFLDKAVNLVKEHPVETAAIIIGAAAVITGLAIFAPYLIPLVLAPLGI